MKRRVGRSIGLALVITTIAATGCKAPAAPPPKTAPIDPVADFQKKAIEAGKSPIAHWGSDPDNYIQWGNHSNRLIPIYTFGTRGKGAGIDLETYINDNSPYRSGPKLEKIYGYLPTKTVNPKANYCDQTNIYDIQLAALKAGKKHIFLVIFDGTSWHATQAAAIVKTGAVFNEGRGRGLFMMDYDANGTSQYGYMCTSPYCDKIRFDVNNQSIGPCKPEGGYDVARGGDTPWFPKPDEDYLIEKGKNPTHVFTDSASSATSMTCGIKTYNVAIGIDHRGKPVDAIAKLAQKQGYLVGIATSVSIPHATPGSAYANNVFRSDYQDISRDMLGLKSISHPAKPLEGLDVVIGAGWGCKAGDKEKEDQGANLVPGNMFIADSDLKAADIAHGGKYLVSQRTAGMDGREKILADARKAAETGNRFLGFYGTEYAHLPYRTTNGDFDPPPGRTKKSEGYKAADIRENPTISDMAEAALTVLKGHGKPFWLMVEAGDVDFAKHDDNIDNMIGAIYSGDKAVETIARWVEKYSNWDESVMIVTADHGHSLYVTDPEALARMGREMQATDGRVAAPGRVREPRMGVDLQADVLEFSLDARGRLVAWGLELDMKNPADVQEIMKQLRIEADARSNPKPVKPGAEGVKVGLPTTIVIRVDKACKYDRFVQLIDLCRANGFAKFQLKAE